MHEGLKRAFNVPFTQAIFSRRSRRFGLGMEVPEGPLAYKSNSPPIPLSREEEAFICWMGTGIKSQNLSDMPPHVGLDLEVQFTSRSNPSLGCLHRSEIFFTNDSGAYMLKLHDAQPEDFVGLEGMDQEQAWDTIIKGYDKYLVKLEPERARFPDKPPGIASHNTWNMNKPGTTVFFPITDLTAGLMDLLFFYVRPSHRYNFIDERNGGRHAGTERWVKEGYLRDDVKLPLWSSETNFCVGYIGELAFISQNMALALQTMGLGGFLFSGFSGMFVLGATPFYKGFGFKFISPPGEFLIPVGREGVFEAFCPPFYKNMDAAVDAFVEYKMKRWANKKHLPYKDPESIMSAVEPPTEKEVQIVKDICNYIYKTYGRFPASMDPMYIRYAVQAHHLDTGFYDKYYPKGAYTQLHAEHFDLWHPEDKNKLNP